MKRYSVRKQNPTRLAHYEDGPDAENYLARTIFEPDDTPIETGILDADGRMIVYMMSIGPIGFTTEFVRSDE